MKLVEKFTDLEKANAYVTEINAAFKTEADEKKAELEKSKTLQTALDKSNNENIAALAEVASLGEKLSLVEANREEGVNIVQFKKKNYKLLGNRFIFNGGEYDAEGVMANNEILAFMVEKGSGSLIKIEN